METNSEQHRQQFSKRLVNELRRSGQPINSPTQIARNFNQHWSGSPVSAQTVRKWLLAEAMPTQPKLLALVKWLGVSAQWLRYGAVHEANTAAPPLSVRSSSATSYGIAEKQSRLEILLDSISQLSARDLLMLEAIVRLMSAEQDRHSTKR